MFPSVLSCSFDLSAFPIPVSLLPTNYQLDRSRSLNPASFVQVSSLPFAFHYILPEVELFLNLVGQLEHRSSEYIIKQFIVLKYF